jgi:hypothetical protein
MASKMKMGTCLNVNARGTSYIRVCCGPQRDEYLHRLIAEALLRRPLKPNETVDHKDQKPLNCAPWNIQVLSWSDHAKVTNHRRYGSYPGVEGVDYEVILDGEKIFQRDEDSAQQ